MAVQTLRYYYSKRMKVEKNGLPLSFSLVAAFKLKGRFQCLLKNGATICRKQSLDNETLSKTE